MFPLIYCIKNNSNSNNKGFWGKKNSFKTLPIVTMPGEQYTLKGCGEKKRKEKVCFVDLKNKPTLYAHHVYLSRPKHDSGANTLSQKACVPWAVNKIKTHIKQRQIKREKSHHKMSLLSKQRCGCKTPQLFYINL